ncbi:MAG: ATP-binding protein, partial [Pseudomonadota bacterium]
DQDTLIGRDACADVNLADAAVSRQHALIRQIAPGEFTIEDLDSRNGTIVNGARVKTHTLKFGEKIQIGSRTLFLFTQRHEIEEHLLHSQKMESIGRLARGIAHDYNNLLSAVLFSINYLESLFEKQGFDKEQAYESLANAKIALKQLTGLTSQLSKFARHGKLEDEPIDFSAVVHEVVGLFQRTFDRSIQIQKDIEPNLVVVGEASKLNQVVMNLCMNALDAMPQGGILSIKVEEWTVERQQLCTFGYMPPGSHVVLSVTDNGVGIDPEIQEKIFEPFFTTKGPTKGTGLGLALVYGIVKNHGGHVEVQSELKKGSTFRVYLPASERMPSTEKVGSLGSGVQGVD